MCTPVLKPPHPTPTWHVRKRHSFEFPPLDAGETESFDVEEEAFYSVDLLTEQAIRKWLACDAPSVPQAIFDDSIRDALQKHLIATDMRAKLELISQQAVSEVELERWGVRDDAHLLEGEHGRNTAKTEDQPAATSSKPAAEAELPDEVRTVLVQQLSCLMSVGDKTHQLDGQQACIAKIETIQHRLRENIKGLDKCQGQSQKLLDRYLSDLNVQEDQLAAANESIDQLR
jgi:hypothetical protein